MQARPQVTTSTIITALDARTVWLVLRRFVGRTHAVLTDDLLVCAWSWRLRETADPARCLLELLGSPAPVLVVDVHLVPYAAGGACVTLGARIPVGPRRARRGAIVSALRRLVEDLEALLHACPTTRRHERTRHVGRVALRVGSRQYQGELFDLAPGGIGIVLGPDQPAVLTLGRGLQAEVRVRRLLAREERASMVVAHVTPRGMGWLVGLHGPGADATRAAAAPEGPRHGRWAPIRLP